MGNIKHTTNFSSFKICDAMPFKKEDGFPQYCELANDNYKTTCP